MVSTILSHLIVAQTSSAWGDLTVRDFLNIIDSEKWLLRKKKSGPRHNLCITKFELNEWCYNKVQVYYKIKIKLKQLSPSYC